jgi:hypothetical protein
MVDICEDNLQYLRSNKISFTSHQDSCRKDVERVFGVLQPYFAIIRYHALTWLQDQMSEVMLAWVIIHNIIIKSECGDRATRDDRPYNFEGPLADVDHQISIAFGDFLAMHNDICED